MSNLQDGINAFKSGKVDDARRFLAAALKENPKDEKAWSWMYQASKDDKERIFCLRKIIEINPANDAARQRLDALMPRQVAPHLPETKYVVPPARPSPKGKPNNLLIIGGSAAVLLIVCCICAFIFYPTGTSTTEPNPIFSTDHKVIYVVNGSATSAFVTYSNEQGGTEQVDVSLPWKKEFSISSSASLSVVAQNGGSGSITCEIWMDGKELKSSTSTAQYGVVTCSDFVY
jgi:hypothetical protein